MYYYEHKRRRSGNEATTKPQVMLYEMREDTLVTMVMAAIKCSSCNA